MIRPSYYEGISYVDFYEYEYNRMYPPRYGKESPMIKLSQKHLDAICHAELFLDPVIPKLESPRLRKHLEDDLCTLAELKLYIITSMTQPKLPFVEPEKENKDPGKSYSNTR